MKRIKLFKQMFSLKEYETNFTGREIKEFFSEKKMILKTENKPFAPTYRILTQIN